MSSSNSSERPPPPLDSSARAGAPAPVPAPAAPQGAPPRPAPPPAEHLQVIADDLGRVALVSLLVLPLARAQAPLDVDLRPLAQVFPCNLREAPEERHTMPFGALLLLAGLLVAPALTGRHPQVRDRGSGGHRAGLGISPQISNDDDLVDATRHGVSPSRECVCDRYSRGAVRAPGNCISPRNRQ